MSTISTRIKKLEKIVADQSKNRVEIIEYYAYKVPIYYVHKNIAYSSLEECREQNKAVLQGASEILLINFAD
ncbi:MAG: hypothetical protein ACK4NC_04865 [Candidatus Gracilibacteria bacterium]